MFAPIRPINIRRLLTMPAPAEVLLPKFVIHLSILRHELRKQKDTSWGV